jgi:anti-sigma-K factor RskA
MSSIADREVWRTGRPVSRPTGWRTELVFWLVLLVLAAVMIAAAVAGAYCGVQPPSETFLVGP